MIDLPGDLVWDLPCVQQASQLEGGPLMWMLPLYLHDNQKSDYDDDDSFIWKKKWNLECCLLQYLADDSYEMLKNNKIKI